MSQASQPKSTARGAAFIDIDRTMIRGSSLLAVAPTLRSRGVVSPKTLIYSVYRQIVFTYRGNTDSELEEGAALAATLIRGQDAIAMTKLGEEMVGDLIVPRIFPEMQKRIDAHRAAGDLIFLVSSAPREIVEPLAKTNAVRADGFASTVAATKDGLYTGDITVFMHGQAKADAVRDLAAKWAIDLSISTAYGDSAGDAHMLDLVGKPICVNPDKGLRAIATFRGWPQVSISVRRRLPLPSSTEEVRHLVDSGRHQLQKVTRGRGLR